MPTSDVESSAKSTYRPTANCAFRKHRANQFFFGGGGGNCCTWRKCAITDWCSVMGNLFFDTPERCVSRLWSAKSTGIFGEFSSAIRSDKRTPPSRPFHSTYFFFYKLFVFRGVFSVNKHFAWPLLSCEAVTNSGLTVACAFVLNSAVFPWQFPFLSFFPTTPPPLHTSFQYFLGQTNFWNFFFFFKNEFEE